MINKNVNPLLALVIIIIFGGIFALKTYFYGLALEVPKPNFLKESLTGTVTIRLGTKIYDYSSEGKLNHIIDLEEFGIVNHIGDYDFFSNGDLLINRDDFLPSFEDRIKHFKRESNTNVTSPGVGKGLQRCNLKTKDCKSFNRSIPAIQDAHYIHIDRKADMVFLADVSRHQIRKLDKDGNLLAELKTGLQFPNQVFLDGETLWIVDTNNHAMKAVKANTETFGEKIETHKFVDVYPRIWPSAFSKVNDNWWVNISNNGMVNASVVIFDKNWGEKSSLNFPENADPVASLVTDNGVIILDANNYQIYTFDIAGIRKADFARSESGDGIKSVLAKNKKQDKKYRSLSDSFFWIGLGLFTLVFIFALFQSHKNSQEDEEELELEAEEQQSITEEEILSLAKLPMEGEWIEAKPVFKFIKWGGILVLLGFVASVAPLLMNSKKGFPLEAAAIFLSIGISMVLFMIPISRLSKYRIGFFKNHVTVETDKGKIISAPYNEIKWTDRGILVASGFTVGEWFLPIGNPEQSFFPYKKFKKRLLPFVLLENKLSGLDGLKLQWNSPENLLKTYVIGILFLVIPAVLSKLGSF